MPRGHPNPAHQKNIPNAPRHQYPLRSQSLHRNVCYFENDEPLTPQRAETLIDDVGVEHRLRRFCRIGGLYFRGRLLGEVGMMKFVSSRTNQSPGQGGRLVRQSQSRRCLDETPGYPSDCWLALTSFQNHGSFYAPEPNCHHFPYDSQDATSLRRCWG